MVTAPGAPMKMAKVLVQVPLAAPAALVQLVGPIFQVPAPPTTVPVGATVAPFQNCSGAGAV